MAEATVGEGELRASGESAPGRLREPPPLPEPSGIDVDALFILHKGNLAVMHEAQAVLADAVQEIVRAQCGCVEQFLAEARAAMLGQDLLRPGAALVRSASTTKEVVELAMTAQQRVADLLTKLARANLGEVGPPIR